MKILKKLPIYLSAFFIIFLVQSHTHAAEKKIENINGIKITQKQYENLKKLGFSDLAINTMDEQAFNENKDLKLDSKVDVTKYYELTESSPEMANTLSISQNKAVITSEELSKEEYFNRVKAKKDNTPVIQALVTNPGTASTSYRRVTTSIQRSGSDIRLYNSFVWDILPVTRSYDVLSISIDNTFTTLAGSNYAQQSWTHWDPNNVNAGVSSDSATYSSGSSTWKRDSPGYGVTMNLKDN